MSKELEALERLYCAGNLNLDYVLSDKHKEDFRIIEKSLKALDIIKDYKGLLNWELFNKYITDEEYDLLKEALE